MIQIIDIDSLVPFENHPFKERSGIEQQELTESIKENGLLEPIIARPFPAGKYEIISGHRRAEACKALGVTSIPVIIKELTKDEPRMEVLKLQTKYPQGGERQLIYATTGRAINSSMLPADAGCVVDNVATISAIYRAVAKGEPSMDRIVTVSGDAVHEPGNFKAPFGMNQAELIEAAGGYKVDPEKIISGGPMMGFSMFTVDVPVTKTSSSILCFTKDEVAQYEPTACINCGRCVEVCPSRLIPSRLADYAEHHDEEAFTKYEGLECMECGSCSYVCPAKRQLKQAIGSMRKTALANRKKK